jgi:hypothetical protein
MTVRYKLGCDLSYEVKGPTAFIFNREVAKLHRHHDLVERLTVTPDLLRRTYIVPDINNRYVSVDAPPGPLHVSYEAEVTLDVFRADPDTINEMPLSLIPLDIMPFLLPSRFVPSDRLAAFANREFGSFPKAIAESLRSATGFTTTSTISAVPRTARPRRTKACFCGLAFAATSRISVLHFAVP